MTSSADDPNWLRPNVAFRIQLGPQYGDVSRVYTVRTCNAPSGSMTFDVVLHGHTSPMMRWAADLRVGDTFSLTGPRPHFLVPEIAGRRVALFADDTAIPALYSILLQWPEGLTGVGWVATGDAEAFAELPVIPGLELHHVEDGLAEYALELDNPGDYAVWGAGERDEMRAIRAHFRKTVGLAKDDVVVFGYWKRGVSHYRDRSEPTSELHEHPRKRRRTRRHRRSGNRYLTLPPGTSAGGRFGNVVPHRL